MTQDDFKKILEDSLGPIREEQKGIRKEQKETRKEQAALREIMEKRVLPPLIYIETTLKAYADQYKANRDHIGRLNKRLTTVEENLEIYPPQELSIPILD